MGIFDKVFGKRKAKMQAGEEKTEAKREVSFDLGELELLRLGGAPEELKEKVKNAEKMLKQKVLDICGVEVGSSEFREMIRLQTLVSSDPETAAAIQRARETYGRVYGMKIALEFNKEEQKAFVVSLKFVYGPAVEQLRSKLLNAYGEKLEEEKNVESLIKALGDKIVEARCSAAETLGEIRDKRALEPLIQALGDESWLLRGEAAKALGNIRDIRAVEPLTQALKDRNEHVRVEAARALGETKDKRAVEPLIEAWKDDDQSCVRSAAADALDKLGWVPRDDTEKAYWLITGEKWDELVELGEPATESLIQILKDKDRTSQDAAIALGKIGDARAVEPLTQALKDKDSDVRAEAARALGEIRDERAVGPLIQVLKDDDQGCGRSAAADALDKLGWVPRDDTEKAYWLITGEKWDELVELGEPATEPLIHAFKYAGTPAKPIGALVRIGEPAVEPLVQALKDEHSGVWGAAIETLGMIGDKRAVEPLTQVLKDDFVGLENRLKAADALDKLGFQPRNEIEKVYLLITREKWDELVELGEPAIEPLMQVKSLFRSPKASGALGALVRIGEPTVEPLIQALKDQYAFTRWQAVTALGMIGDARAIEPLTQVLMDMNIEIQEAAKKALENIQGK